MILEAFSQQLHSQYCYKQRSAQTVLQNWLLAQLSEALPNDIVTRVLQTEIGMDDTTTGLVAFYGKSTTGEVLLNSLIIYCDSYEHWQFRRWVHELKPATFNHR